MPSGKHNAANDTTPAGNEAAMASPLYRNKNIRSMKCMIVHETVETISGIASRNTSRPPAGADHQPVDSGTAVATSSERISSEGDAGLVIASTRSVGVAISDFDGRGGMRRR